MRAAFFGKIEPATDTLVKTGPYRLLRHPLYLGMIVMMLGISLSLGSSRGIVATLLLFVPAVVYRATLEERALERRFGAQWRKYKEGTFFMVPGLK